MKWVNANRRAKNLVIIENNFLTVYFSHNPYVRFIFNGINNFLLKKKTNFIKSLFLTLLHEAFLYMKHLC